MGVVLEETPDVVRAYEHQRWAMECFGMIRFELTNMDKQLPSLIRAAAHDLWGLSGHGIDGPSWEECEPCIRDVANTKLAGVPVILPSGWHCLKREE